MVKVIELWIFSHGNLYTVSTGSTITGTKNCFSVHVSFGLTSLENPTPAVPALTYSLT